MADATHPQDRATTPLRQRRAWLAVGATLVLLLILRAALPLVLARAVSWAAPAMGARASAANVDLGLLRGSLVVEDLRIGLPSEGAAGGDGPEEAIEPSEALLHLERLALELRWRSLFSKRLQLEAVELQAPTVRVTQDESGSFLLPTPPETDAPDAAAAPEATNEAEAADELEATDEAEAADEQEGSTPWEVQVDRLALRSADLRLGSEGYEESVTRLRVGELSLDGFGLGPEGIALQGFALRSPKLDLHRPWLMQQLASAPTAEATAGEESAGAPTPFAAGSIELDSGDFVVQTVRGPLELGFQVRADEVATAPGSRFPVELVLRIGEGEIQTAGRLGLSPLAYGGELEWNDLALPPITLLGSPDLHPWLESYDSDGRLRVELQSEAEDGRPPGVRLQGHVEVADVSFEDPDGAELALGWKHLRATLEEAFVPFEAGEAAVYHLGEVHVEGPRVVFTRPPDAVDRLLLALGGGPAEAAPEPEDGAALPEAADPAEGEEPEAPPTRIRLDALQIRDGDLRFRDRAVSPPLENRIRSLDVVGRGISLPEQDAERIAVSGLVDESPFSVQGRLQGGNGDVALELRRLGLVPFDRYSRGVGWRIGRGDTTLVSKIRIEGTRYRLKNQLTLHDLRVDTENPGTFASAFGVSVDLALALLRDPKGNIGLSLPVEWGEEEVGVGVGRVLLDALRSALVGALASPLKLAGALVGGRGEDASGFAPIRMEAGRTDLDAAGRERVDSLTRLLLERPSLGLSLSGVHAEVDHETVSEEQLRERAVAGEDLPRLEGAGFFERRRIREALRKRAEGEEGSLSAEDQALLARMIEAAPPEPARLEQLARRRAEVLAAALRSEGVAEESLAFAPPQQGAQPGVALGLEAR